MVFPISLYLMLRIKILEYLIVVKINLNTGLPRFHSIRRVFPENQGVRFLNAKCSSKMLKHALFLYKIKNPQKIQVFTLDRMKRSKGISHCVSLYHRPRHRLI
jgi:hypothetical protein